MPPKCQQNIQKKKSMQVDIRRKERELFQCKQESM
jgi:hypothetical protein